MKAPLCNKTHTTYYIPHPQCTFALVLQQRQATVSKLDSFKKRNKSVLFMMYSALNRYWRERFRNKVCYCCYHYNKSASRVGAVETDEIYDERAYRSVQVLWPVLFPTLRSLPFHVQHSKEYITFKYALKNVACSCKDR